MTDSLSARLLSALEASPSGIATLPLLESLAWADAATLKTTLSRLNRAGKILRLKRGLYSVRPLKDVFYASQVLYNGYLGFSTALFLHKLIAEMPFTVTVVTPNRSATCSIADYEVRAVALKKMAVGSQKLGKYVVSSRPKTLFDCLCVPRYSIEYPKLIQAYRQARLPAPERKEFGFYEKKYAQGKKAKRIQKAKELLGWD